jgi:hypothetical protein
MKHLGKTPPFRGQRGESVPGSIAEIAYLRLGGLDQWAMIRGENIANPPLISTLIAAHPPAPSHLRTLGWTLVGTSVLTAAIVGAIG